MVVNPYRMVWRQILGSRVYLVYSFLVHTFFFISEKKSVPWHRCIFIHPQFRIMSITSILLSKDSSYRFRGHCRYAEGGNGLCKWTLLIQQRRLNNKYARPIAALYSSDSLTGAIFIRVLNGQTKKAALDSIKVESSSLPLILMALAPCSQNMQP